MVGWYRAGLDVQAHLPVLSALLGHASSAHTFWYLQATPELLALAAERLESRRSDDARPSGHGSTGAAGADGQEAAS